MLPEESSVDDPAERSRERFDFYVVALTFTFLGLALQTNRFGNNSVSDCAELIGWLYVGVSGIFGLQHLKQRPWKLTLAGLKQAVVKMTQSLREFDETAVKLKSQREEISSTIESGVGIDSEAQEDAYRKRLQALDVRLEEFIRLKDRFRPVVDEVGEFSRTRLDEIDLRSRRQLALFGAGVVMLLFARALPALVPIFGLPSYFAVRIG